MNFCETCQEEEVILEGGMRIAPNVELNADLEGKDYNLKVSINIELNC